MTYTFKLSRRLASLERPLVPMLALLLLLGCNEGALTGDSESADGPTFDSASSGPVIEPKSAVAQTNQSIQFKVRPRSGGDWGKTTVSWMVSGGTITGAGLFTAAQPGRYKVTVRGGGGKRQKTDTAVVIVVTPPADLEAVVTTPDSAVVTRGSTRRFSAVGELRDGSTAPIGVAWSASGGSIDAGGVYSAGSASGTFAVVATSVDGTLADTAIVEIPSDSTPATPPDSTPTTPPDSTPATPPPAPTLAAVMLSPATVTLASGAQQQFVATGRLTDSSSVTLAVRFEAQGGAITPSGLYTAGQTAGAFRVIARDTATALADTSLVTIPAQPAPQPTNCTPTPTSFCPGDNLAAKVSAAPTGTAFTFAPGMYRLQSITPKTGQSFTGPRTAIMSGAILVTEWTRSSGGWSAPVSYTPGAVSGTCVSGSSACQYPNDVYRDDVLQRSGFTLTATTLTVTSDPTGHRWEVSALPKAFGGAASGVTLRGFTVEKYAAPYNAGAVSAASAPNWVIDGIEGRWNHGAAVFAGPSNRVVNGYFHHNGQYGVMGNAPDMVFERNEVAYNNTAGFSPNWASGGSKFAFTVGLQVRNNFFHHNYGHAIWVDIANYQALIEGNRVEDNEGRGVFYEISYDAVIRNNTFARNGSKSPVLLRGGCIGVVSSPNVEVYGNTCVGDKDGITGVQDARGSGPRGAYELTNLYVHDNTLSGIQQYAAGIVQTVNDASYYTSRNNRWSGNVYSGLNLASPFYWSNGARTMTQWRGYGQQ